MRDLGENHAAVTGEPAAPKRCTAGSGRRPLEKDPHSGNLASGLPVLEHSESRSVTVVFFRTARTATVSVTDEGHGCASVPDLPGAEQENGRGLLIIDTLAGRWGQRKTDGGFTVWAEIAVRSAPGPAGQPTGPAK